MKEETVVRIFAGGVLGAAMLIVGSIAVGAVALVIIAVKAGGS